VVAGEVLAKLDVLKVPGSGLVRLDAFEAGRGRFSAVLARHLQKLKLFFMTLVLTNLDLKCLPSI
jgi:hypothetical protein